MKRFILFLMIVGISFQMIFAKGGRRPQPIHGQPDAALSGTSSQKFAEKTKFHTVLVKEDISLPRYPAVSPDAQNIVFSYRSDIWISSIDGGEARRITDHIADDIRPVFSPDGKHIAFSSDRKGNYDVYVIPVEGGLPRQVTFRSSDDLVSDWSSDGKSIIFLSRRDIHFYYGNIGTYKISIKGGMPTPVINQMAKNSKLSPGDKLIAFNINRVPDFRQRYRGSANNDIYTCDLETNTYSKLTNHPGNDKWPVFGGSRIFYVSDKDNTFNIWKMNTDGSDKTQVTFHKGDQVRFPAVSADGKIIVYEYLDKLYRKDEGKDPYPLKIYAPSDYKTDPVVTKHYTSDASEMAVSAGGEFIAFVIRGEIFLLKKDWEKAKNLTNNAAREKNISWSPDGKSLLFTSDRNGNNDLFLISSASDKDIYFTFDYDTKSLTQSEKEEYSGMFSPDGEKIAYIEGNGNLVMMDKDGKNKRTIWEGWSLQPNFQWSPDSGYIAFSREDNNFNQDVYIYELNQDKIYNISMHPDDDHTPCWSPNGRFLYFLSKRSDNNTDIWQVALTKQWYDMTEDEWKQFLEKEEKKDDEKEKSKKPKGKPDVSPVTIDFKDIRLRMTHITRLLGEELELVITDDSKNIVFTAQNDEGAGLYSIKWNGKDKTVLVPKVPAPSALTLIKGKKGTDCYYISNGKLYQLKLNLSTGNGKGSANAAPKAIPFGARLVIDRFKENSQKFDEAWRLMRDNFYDPNFHGADWDALYKKYRPWALQTMTIPDFNFVFTMMLGELNASHLGIYAPDRGRTEPGDVTTGLIGVLFDPAFSGPGFKVKKVLRDSPADRYQSKLYPGDIITAINGEPVAGDSNFYRIMAYRVNEKVLLEVLREKGKQKQTINIEITPVDNQGQMVYQTWIEETREKVEQLSDGKLAYLHIQGMGWPNLEKFEDELYSVAHGKEGLIIDVRYNGGGWITDYLLQILMTQQHAVTIPRGGGKGYPHSRRSIFSWSRPIVVLINHQSYSNAEIFPWAIRTLKRGPIVGKQTFGAVISTGGTALIDGTFLRLPFRGWYVNDGTMTNQELHGCKPHYPVENLPGEESAGIDRQLQKAVEVLQQEVEKSQKDSIWRG
jgi:Tol biopolymer transport system component/C-terminal processing protease CtpA/Prc